MAEADRAVHDWRDCSCSWRDGSRSRHRFFLVGVTSVAGVPVLVADGAVPENDKDVPVDVALLLLMNRAEWINVTTPNVGSDNKITIVHESGLNKVGNNPSKIIYTLCKTLRNVFKVNGKYSSIQLTD